MNSNRPGKAAGFHFQRLVFFVGEYLAASPVDFDMLNPRSRGADVRHGPIGMRLTENGAIIAVASLPVPPNRTTKGCPLPSSGPSTGTLRGQPDRWAVKVVILDESQQADILAFDNSVLEKENKMSQQEQQDQLKKRQKERQVLEQKQEEGRKVRQEEQRQLEEQQEKQRKLQREEQQQVEQQQDQKRKKRQDEQTGK
jgi:hypothetical protein